MEQNVGGMDRNVRLILAPMLLILGIIAFFIEGTLYLVLGIIALIVAAIFGITGYTQKCPLNSLFGFNTFKKKAEM